MAKRLKKEKVNVDVINFGEEVFSHQSSTNTHTPNLSLRCCLVHVLSPHSFSCLQEMNTEKLTAFINTLNGKEGAGSHLVTVPPGPSLADALLSSPILAGEGGAVLGLGASDFEFGVDPSADPELALVREQGKDDHFMFTVVCVVFTVHFNQNFLVVCLPIYLGFFIHVAIFLTMSFYTTFWHGTCFIVSI